jgi:hypothetical protein
MRKHNPLAASLALGYLLVAATPAQAQSAQVFAYPSGGQSQQQQEADRYQCHQWAVSQTGFDPTAMPPPQAVPPPPPQGYSDQPPPQQQQSSGGFLGIGNGGMFKGGGMLGDAATGAALGAAGGALAGNAGQGAAIGALASTVLGVATKAVKGNTQPPPAPPSQGYDYYQQNQAQAAQERQRRMGDYNGAFGACMKARNYTIN